MPTKTRVQTVRLPAEQVLDLETLAGFDGVTVAQEIREAIGLLIESRKHDSAFLERVQARFARTRQLLERDGENRDLIEALGL